MRVTNETDYQTSQLKALARFIAMGERLLPMSGRLRLRIRFVDRGTRAQRGTSMNPGSIQIGVFDKGGVFVKEELARKIAWGIGISVGLQNKDMVNLPKYWPGKKSLEYYEGLVSKFPIERKPPVPKPVKPVSSGDVKRKRLEIEVLVYKNKVAQWQRNLSRSMDKIREYQKKLDRAEKSLAKLPLQPVVPVEDAEPTVGRRFREIQP